MSDYRSYPPPGRRGSRGGDPYFDAPLGGGGGGGPPSNGRPYPPYDLPPPPRDSRPMDHYYDRPPRDGRDRRGPPERDDRRASRGGRGGYSDGAADRRMSRGYEGGERDDMMRSPEYERGGGRPKRRRSPSPGGRRDDFYDRAPLPVGRGDLDPRDIASPGPPRHFHGDDRRGGYKPRRSGPRGSDAYDQRGGPGYDQYDRPPSHQAPPPTLEAPHTLPFHVAKGYFADWFRTSSPPSLADSAEALEEAWKKYESDFLRREAKPAFEQFKELGKEWFSEKYEAGAEAEEARRMRRRTQREGRVQEWVEKADKGELDAVSFEFDEQAARRPPILPNNATPAEIAAQIAAAGGNGAADAERNGRDGSESGEGAAKSEDAKDTAASGELKPSGPEAVIVPAKPEQICIARVPPEVAFDDLEAVFKPFEGFLRLSVSDAAPHAAFLRLAWATFSSGDLAKAAMGAIRATAPPPPAPVESKPENGGDAEMKETPVVPAEGEGEGENKGDDKPAEDDANGDKPPSPEPAPAPYAIGTYNLALSHILSIRDTPVEARVRAAPALVSTSERLQTDLQNMEKVFEALETQAVEDGLLGAEGEVRKGSEVIREKRKVWEEEVEAKKEGMDEEVFAKEMLGVARRTMDLSLSYLRSVFDTCYYCCISCESPEMLGDMCPKHLRRADENFSVIRKGQELAWSEGFDKRVPLLFPRSSLDVRDFGGESKEEELYRLVGPHVKQEEEGKFRCKECNKLFAARKFVEKHVALKHPEFVGDKVEQLAYYNNYVLDPSRIPLAQFQRENYLPSILNPPPPPPPPSRYNAGMDRPLADRIGPKRPRIEPRRDDAPSAPGPPAPPPAGQKLDPRAGRGASSYADLDDAPAGADIVLPY